jgi:hypothetical protein
MVLSLAATNIQLGLGLTRCCVPAVYSVLKVLCMAAPAPAGPVSFAICVVPLALLRSRSLQSFYKSHRDMFRVSPESPIVSVLPNVDFRNKER